MTKTEKEIRLKVKEAERLELEEIILLVTNTFKSHHGYFPDFLLERKEDYDYEEEQEINDIIWILSEGQTNWDGMGESIKDLYVAFYEEFLEKIYSDIIYEEEEEEAKALASRVKPVYGIY